LRFKGKIAWVLSLLGFDVKALLSFFTSIGPYLHDYRELKRQRGSDNAFRIGRPMPIFGESAQESGKASGHYFHQDLLVARKVFLANPKRHVDIGSRIDGFVAHVAVFRQIEVFDIRTQRSSIPNIRFVQCDMMNLPPEMAGCCDSVSSLHAIEHFGLGRYGDRIDYAGHEKAIENISKMLMPGGKFYFSVPIGDQRIEFNAHRVFSVSYLMEMLESRFALLSFSYVNDAGDLKENVPVHKDQLEQSYGCHLGCGIFELARK
jgi:SAM-dependent methyltransferase